MIKTLGIELKASRAVYVALEGTGDDFKVVDSGFIELSDAKIQITVKSFYQKWMVYLDDGDFNRIGIKERISKGRFAGGAISFKMEGLIQLSDYQIEIVHSSKIRSKLKGLDPVFGKIHSYQEEAARLAYYLLIQSEIII